MPVNVGVFIVGLIIAVMSISVVLMIREPTLKNSVNKKVRQSAKGSENQPLLTAASADEYENLTLWDSTKKIT